MRNLLLAACAALASVALPAQAALVNHGDYASDTVTGLNWYNMTLTQGLSYDQTVAELSTTLSGWQLATADQVRQLYTDAGLPPSTYVPELSGYVTQVDTLSAAVGDTLLLHHASQYVSGVDGFYLQNPADLAQNMAYVADAMLDGNDNATIAGPGLAGFVWADQGIANYAPFLVSAASPSEVPEPAGLAIFGAGLLALAGWRRMSA